MFVFLKETLYQAGEIIKKHFHENKTVRYKGKIDLVTEVDVKVEEFVKNRLAKELPDYKIIAEESFEGKFQTEKVIFLDPIDGTTNFVHGFPFVAVSLAVIDKDFKLGIVYNPILDEFFHGIKGKGAFLNGRKIKVSSTNALEKSLIATGFPYSSVSEDLEGLLFKLSRVLKNTRGIRRAGSAAIDLCYVAKGVFDGYYESNLKPWDVEAGKIIVKEAGGTVTNLEKKEHKIDDKFIVATNGKILNALLELLNGF